MKFNRYIFDLFLASDEGKKSIAFFDGFTNLFKDDPNGKLKKFINSQCYDESLSDDYIKYIVSEANGWFEEFNLFHSDPDIPQNVKEVRMIKSIEEAENFFNFYLDEPLGIDSDYDSEEFDQHSSKIYPEDSGQDDSEETEDYEPITPHSLLSDITPLSFFLFRVNPEYFFPYVFGSHFFKLEFIFREFNISLPKVPKKREYKKRLMYYFELCKELYDFRNRFDFSPSEFCSFLYHFAPNFIGDFLESELPEATKVYLIGCHNGQFESIDSAVTGSIAEWQCNLNTLPGDIILLYCSAPRSYIHSIWRSISVGFADPFHYYYNIIWMKYLLPIKPIYLRELKSDPLLSQNKIVKSNMQGMNGAPFTKKEYDRILEIQLKKGMDISKLPKLMDIAIDENIEINNERDVEEKLLEPFLNKFGYTSDDWTRQMPVRMGRGERNYPDYVIHPSLKKGEESGKFIWEAKFHIQDKAQLREDFVQAKSYALRLNSEGLGIVAYEGIWIVTKAEKFEFENLEHYPWNKVKEPDSFNKLILKIGKKKAKSL